MTKQDHVDWQLHLGANLDQEENVTFKVWAPYHPSLSVNILGKNIYPMTYDQYGFFSYKSNQIEPGDHYYYVMGNGLNRPDPISRSLPQGIHGPTQIIKPFEFQWNDSNWKGLALREAIIYEIHIGTFTSKGTFDAIIEKLDYLKELGINCIELMPLIQFPGDFNWGYDGASLYAPFNGYGGVNGFKRLINACHQVNIAVCLDVVYNHLGPEGNYLEEFGPYFSKTYHTPWGKAFNYDGAHSDPVREYVIQNALYWIAEYHIDMLRLDAIHGIYDFSATPMLSDLVDAVEDLGKNLGRATHIIAESGQNDTRVIRSRDVGGLDFCGIWNDDYHHAVHVSLTGEQTTYYQDFKGIKDLAKSLSQGFVYDGKYSSFRKRKHGNASIDIPFDKFIVFSQNHDQIGNRPLGERLSTLVNQNRLKIAACLSILSPSVPMLFMGEEYGEKAPFEYFVDYENEKLMRSIYEGRKKEFHRHDMPFPGKESFDNSRLTWVQNEEIFLIYKQLINLRKCHPPKEGIVGKDLFVEYSPEDQWLYWEYPTSSDKNWIGVFIHLGLESCSIFTNPPFKRVKGEVILSSEKESKKECELNIASESFSIFI